MCVLKWVWMCIGVCMYSSVCFVIMYWCMCEFGVCACVYWCMCVCFGVCVCARACMHACVLVMCSYLLCVYECWCMCNCMLVCGHVGVFNLHVFCVNMYVGVYECVCMYVLVGYIIANIY